MISDTHALHMNRPLDYASQPWRHPTESGLKDVGWVVLLGLLISLPILALGGWHTHTAHVEKESARLAFIERLGAHDRLLAAPAKTLLPLDPVVHGMGIFESTCAACHKADGTGVPGLGRDLTKSWFVASLEDDQLKDFVLRGRPVTDPLNTTKIPMPPKGGHDELTDADLGDVVAFVRGLQDPRRMPPLPASALLPVAAAPPSEEEKANALAAAGGDAELAGYIAHGTKVFTSTCVACHGKDAKGIKNLGKDLVASDFVRKQDDDALLAFLKRGRNPGDPLNTTKVDMPPKGGNPALSDDDLLDVIAYVRSLQKQSPATP